MTGSVNSIEININMQALHNDYPQGTTSIPNSKLYSGDQKNPPSLSHYITYSVDSWSGKQKPVIDGNTITVGTNSTFDWVLVDTSNSAMKLTLATPMDKKAFFSESETTNAASYRVVTVSQEIANSDCTFALLSENNTQRYVYAWDPVVIVTDDPG